MSRNRDTKRCIATLLTALVVVLAAVPLSAAGQSDDTDIGIVSADVSDDLSTAEKYYAIASGIAAGIMDGAGDRVDSFRGTGPAADEEADALADEITTNREAYRTHLNGLIDEYNGTVANETEVLRIDVTDDDTTEPVYIRVVANGSKITSLNASRSADWTVTRTHELSATDAEDLNDDLDEYRADYIEADEYPEPSYFVKQGSKYVNISEVRS